MDHISRLISDMMFLFGIVKYDNNSKNKIRMQKV